MPFTIINKDITKIEVDAIVNSTNNYAIGVGGADFAINAAAGPELLKARLALGDIPPCSARITAGYNLKAKHVIHVIAPRYIDGNHGERELLEATYLAAMKLADKENLESLAFPLISSGHLGFPWRTALSIALASVKRFLEKSEMMIYVLVYEKPNFDEYEEVPLNFNKMEEQRADIFYDRDIIPERRKRIARYHAPRSVKEAFQVEEETFTDKVLRLIDDKDLNDVYVYTKANIDRKLFSKLRSNHDYQPSKITAIALALALELDLHETLSLLAKAGYTLSDSQPFDRVIAYFISEEKYDLYEINAELFSLGLKTIGLD